MKITKIAVAALASLLAFSAQAVPIRSSDAGVAGSGTTNLCAGGVCADSDVLVSPTSGINMDSIMIASRPSINLTGGQATEASLLNSWWFRWFIYRRCHFYGGADCRYGGGGGGDDPPHEVPEPGMLLLMGSALILLSIARPTRRRKRKA